MVKQPPAKRKRKAVMKNQRQAKRRRRKEAAAAGSMEDDDRISQLPQDILHHHILSLLPQKDAVQTCILSKSWRHLGPTRPKLEFESPYPENEKRFRSVVENTLQRYHDQKLPIQEFILDRWGELSSKSVSLLKKWIPIVIKNNTGLKTFSLRASEFPLPSVVFQAEFIKLRVLKRLSLKSLYIEEETFDKIMSSCPLIEHLDLVACTGLSTIKVKKARYLKHFGCCVRSIFSGDMIREKDKSIEIDDAPSLETIRIQGGPCEKIWYHHNNYFFPRLKSLYLWSVRVPTELLNNLSSNNCPCLEELELHNCSGFTEFELSNCSIKRLIINTLFRPIKAAIDAANMLYFKFQSNYLPTFSFTPTSRKWKSRIKVWGSVAYDESNWPLKLHEFLKSLSQSEISLDVPSLPLTNQDTYDGGSCEPVVVEHLCFKEYYSSSALRVFLNRLFLICRPRNIAIGLSLCADSRKLAKSIWTTLVKKEETKFWQQDLEESSIQVSHKNANEWHPFQVCEFSNNEEIRFRLKWREKS